MGRKSRTRIEKDLNREYYYRYQRMLADPEYRSLWEKRNRTNQEINANPTDVKSWNEKKSIERKLIDKYRLAIVDVPPSIWGSLTEEEKKSLELPIDPLKLLTEEEFENFPGPIFLDMDIVKAIPFEEPKLIQADEPPTIKGEKQEPSSEKRIWSRIDYTGFLRDDQFLMVEINTRNTIEKITVAVKEKLEFLRDIEAIKFIRKVHLSTEEERIRAIKLKAQGKSLKEIAYEMWPARWEEEERKIAEIAPKENVEGEERILYEQLVQRCLEEGKTYAEALDEADKKFGLKEKKIVNPLIKKVQYLLSDIPK